MCGQICIWRYTSNTRNYPGYQMTANPAGCDALERAFDDIETRYPYRTLKLDRPDEKVLAAPNNRRADIVTWTRLRLETSTVGLVFEENTETLTMGVSSADFANLRKGLSDIRIGEGDWSIEGVSAPLWVWWYPG